MFDDGIIEEFAGDIMMWTNFYIVADDESINMAKDFQNKLDQLKISSVLLHDDSQYDFDDWDCLLAISKAGSDEFILDVVKLAKSMNVKVYGICVDFKSDLARSCDECIFTQDDDFSAEAMEFLDVTVENIENQLDEEEYHLESPFYLGPSKAIFIISDYELLPYAKMLANDLSSMMHSVSIITEEMEDKFKENLDDDDSVIAISNNDDGFVVDMAKFAKSRDIPIIGCGFVYCENFMHLCDNFNALGPEDATKAGLDYSKFYESKQENDKKDDEDGNKFKIILLLIVLVLVVFCLLIFK